MGVIGRKLVSITMPKTKRNPKKSEREKAAERRSEVREMAKAETNTPLWKRFRVRVAAITVLIVGALAFLVNLADIFPRLEVSVETNNGFSVNGIAQKKDYPPIDTLHPGKTTTVQIPKPIIPVTGLTYADIEIAVSYRYWWIFPVEDRFRFATARDHSRGLLTWFPLAEAERELGKYPVFVQPVQ